jgi:hypothetical protein
MLSTSEMISKLTEEGFRLTRSRLETLINSGRVRAPKLVGTNRVWMEPDVDQVRRVLVSMDGAPTTVNAKPVSER